MRGIYYNSPNLDNLMDEQARIVDPILRFEKLKQVQKAVQDEAPMIFGYDEGQAFASAEGAHLGTACRRVAVLLTAPSGSSESSFRP